MYHRQNNPKLEEVYHNPQLPTIKKLYHQLITSEQHYHREIAFWLELAVQQPTVELNIAKLSREFQEIEILLSNIMWQVDDDARKGLNNWLNYLLNIPQSLRSRHVIDAKILISLAMDSCKDQLIENIKRNSKLARKIEVLQAETIRLYEIIIRIPAHLTLPQAHINVIYDLQDVVIKLLQDFDRDPNQIVIRDLVRDLVARLETSQRALMRKDQAIGNAKKELEHARDRLAAEKTRIPQSSLSYLESLPLRLNRLLQSLNSIDDSKS
ncbi:MAG: hypothetical protein JSV76_03595 [Candidatus Bathyarchaeota archaeon]|nr:MAG: hypothetical protein JSV76_03595 [Candidatus Bathyarchaeota archaeon]